MPERKLQKKKTAVSREQAGLEDVDELWLGQHAREVIRMLPGGIDILGIFALASTNELKTCQDRLRQLLFSLHKSLQKEKNQQLTVSTDRILLQIDNVTRSVVCRTVNVSDYKSDIRPGDWKYQSLSNRWIKISSQVSLDCASFVPVSRLGKSRMRQVQSSIKPFLSNIHSALALVNGHMRDDDELLLEDGSGDQAKRRKHKSPSESCQREFKVDLLISNQLEAQTNEPPEVRDCCAKFGIMGTYQCIAYVHSKASVANAVSAIKADIIRSLMTRFEFLHEVNESLYDHEQGPDTQLKCPVRTFVPLPNCGISVSDYIFPSEAAKDVVSTLRDWLDVEVDEDTVNSHAEQAPGDDDCCILREDNPESIIANEHSTHVLAKYVTPVVSVAMAGLVAVLSYIVYLGQE